MEGQQYDREGVSETWCVVFVAAKNVQQMWTLKKDCRRYRHYPRRRSRWR